MDMGRNFGAIILAGLLVLPGFAVANGGDQRVVEGRYLINLSRAPFTPRAGERISTLISFVDLKKNKLISEDLLVKIRIAKLGGAGTEKRTFLFERASIEVKGGVLEFPYTFNERGLHEVFIDFAFARDPKNIFESPDFLLDVQEQKTASASPRSIFIGTGAGVLAGGLLGWFLRSKRRIPA